MVKTLIAQDYKSSVGESIAIIFISSRQKTKQSLESVKVFSHILSASPDVDMMYFGLRTSSMSYFLTSLIFHRHSRNWKFRVMIFSLLYSQTYKTGRREVPGSIPGFACRPSHSEFSPVFSETRVNTG